jgi:hypothetical protein
MLTHFKTKLYALPILGITKLVFTSKLNFMRMERERERERQRARERERGEGGLGLIAISSCMIFAFV